MQLAKVPRALHAPFLQSQSSRVRFARDFYSCTSSWGSPPTAFAGSKSGNSSVFGRKLRLFSGKRSCKGHACAWRGTFTAAKATRAFDGTLLQLQRSRVHLTEHFYSCTGGWETVFSGQIPWKRRFCSAHLPRGSPLATFASRKHASPRGQAPMALTLSRMPSENANGVPS